MDGEKYEKKKAGLIQTESIQAINVLKGDSALKKYGIEIIDNPKNVFVQKMKDTIIEMVYLEEKLPGLKRSAYLADKLNQSYGHLSSIF